MRIKTRFVLTLALSGLFSFSLRADTLFIGSDTRTFSNTLPDQLGIATISGANFVSQVTVNESFHLNGLGDGPGFLYAGVPTANTLNTIDYNGNLLTTTAAPGIPNGVCCNEEMQLVGNVMYHVHWADEIERLDPTTGAAILPALPQDQVVGMALVGNTIWISKWTPKTVGTWDPITNIYTPMFSVADLAGGIAYDPGSGLMWVGQGGGNVIPYTLAGVQAGPGFKPFGAIPDTIDGLTFRGEASQVPEPSSLLLLGTVLGAVAYGLKRRIA